MAVATSIEKVPRRLRKMLSGVPWLSIASLATVVTAWQVIGMTTDLRALPAVTEVWAAWWALYNEGIGEVLLNSLRTFAIGITIATIAAVVVTILMTVSLTARQVLTPYIDGGMSIPITATIPVLMLLFGLGDITRIIVVILFSVFVMIISMRAGVEKVNPDHLQMAAAFGADRRQVLRKVTLPSAFTLAITGIRLGITRGFRGMVTAEVIISTAGIGWLLIRSSRLFDLASVYAITGTIVVASAILTGTLGALERRVYRTSGS